MKLLKLVGHFLVLLSFYYIYHILQNNFNKIELDLSWYTVFIIICLLSLSLISYMLLAYTWLLQVKKRYPAMTFQKSFSFIGLSQIAKYLPGNFGHILARGVMLKKHMNPKDIALSFIIESFLMILISGAFSLLYLKYINFIDYLSIRKVLLLSLCALVAVPCGYLFVRRKIDMSHLSATVLLQMVSLFALVSLSAGLSITLITTLYPDTPDIGYWQYTSGFALSFILGFIMPGAPAGIGIREATFVMLFGSALGKQIAMEVILIIRLIGLLSDIIAFFIGYGLKSKLMEDPNATKNGLIE